MLMNRLVDGDRAAFEPLFHALYPRALRLARRQTGSLAEDVAQSAMLKVFSRSSEFTKNKPVLPWFYAVVANEVRSVWRREARLARPVEANDKGILSPEDEALEAELARVLQASHRALGKADREAIEALLGHRARPSIDDATFRKRVSRAIARLRALVAGFYED